MELEPCDDWHDVVLIVNGETVYKCDITKLEFGMCTCSVIAIQTNSTTLAL